jgi:hypothetical protein
LSIDDFEDSIEKTFAYLSERPELFVTDGTFGSSAGSYARTVCEDAACGLFLKHLTVPRRTPQHVKANQDIKVFIANQIPGADAGVAVVKFDKEASRVFAAIAGTNPGPDLLDAIAKISLPIVAERSKSVALAGCVFTNPENASKTGLTFGTPAEWTAAAVRNNLAAAHHCLLSSAGLARVWNGAVLPAPLVAEKLARGDLTLSGSSTLPFAADNSVSIPSVVSFVEEGGGIPHTLCLLFFCFRGHLFLCVYVACLFV